MKNILTLLIAFLLSISACFAQKDTSKNDAWLKEIRAENPKVVGAEFTKTGQAVKFTFSADATKQEIIDANAKLSEFATYTPPAKPDYKAFKGAVFGEEQLPLAIRLELLKFYPVLDYVERGEASVAQLQAAWAGIKSQLDPGVAAVVESYATVYAVPLIP